MQIGTKQFQDRGKTYLMGILNVTPDSFSDGGQFRTLDAALYQAQSLIAQGADILDIGGESTRPGYTKISDAEEIDRVVPVIEGVKARFDIPLSLDTYKSQVAQAGLRAGADLINDIWGLKYDGDMGQVIARSGAACCLMHNRAQADYTHFFPDLLDDLRESLSLADAAGIPRQKIILDPGVGFAKSYEENLEILRRLGALSTLGCPILLGASRKSVVGLTLNLPTDQRLEGTLVTTVFAVLAGCQFVRVHDVEANRRAIAMAEAIVTGGYPHG